MAYKFKYWADFFKIMEQKLILKNIIFINEDLKEYYNLRLANTPYNTQKMRLFQLTKFFTWIGKKTATSITKEDIIKFLQYPKFTNQKNTSKNYYITVIRQFLVYFKRDDMAELLPFYRMKSKEINKNQLINRDDLEKLLKSCEGIKQKALLMTLYESATRKDEFLNIERRDVQFVNDDKGNVSYINLYIRVSKTIIRNIPLKECIPFIKEYFAQKHFESQEKLFDYTAEYLNQLLNKINNRCKQKFPEYNKKLHPHLLRHSRLTELASNHKLNDQQLKKFAGWTKASNMASIYVHLDDSDIINTILEDSGVTLPKPIIKTFETVKCPQCSELNNKINDICWKCHKILNSDMISKVLTEREQIEELKQENTTMKEQINEIFKNVKDMNSLIHLYVKAQQKTIKNMKVSEPPAISDQDVEVSDEVLQDAIEEGEYKIYIKEHPEFTKSNTEPNK